MCRFFFAARTCPLVDVWMRPGPYELRVQYESSENGQEISKVAGPAWQLVAPMRHFFAFEGGGSRSVQPCLASCWCLLPTPKNKKIEVEPVLRSLAGIMSLFYISYDQTGPTFFVPQLPQIAG